jgi:hypothetical protein
MFSPPRFAHTPHLLRRALWNHRAPSLTNSTSLGSTSMLCTRLAEGLASQRTTTMTTIPSNIRTISHTRPSLADRSVTDLTYDAVSTTEIVKKLAAIPQTSVSLQALMRTGRGEFLHKTFEDMEHVDQHSATDLVLIQVASFLRRELPIRLAHRIQDLEGAPVMRDMSSVKDVKELYMKSMMELVEFDEKITTSEQEEAFSALVERIYERHGSVLVRK